MKTIKRTVLVTIEKEIEIELTQAVFGSMTEDEYLAEFRRSLWDVEGIDDVVKYAARMAADNGDGYEHDVLGLIGRSWSTYPRAPDVKFDVVSEDYQAEIMRGEA